MSDKIAQLLKIHEKLLTFVDINSFPNNPGLKDGCCIFLFTKSTKTFRAIQYLCDNGIGYGEDAIILTRSLLENLISIAYMVNPAEQQEQEHRAELFRSWLLIDWNKFQRGLREGTSIKTQLTQILQKIDSTTQNYKNAKKLIDDEIQQLKKNNYQTTTRSWSGLPLKLMAKEVGLLDFYYDTAYWHISQIVHPHPGWIDSYIKRQDKDINICAMPGPDKIDDALILSFGCYLKVVSLINTIFSLNLNDKLNEIDIEAANLVKTL